MRKPNASGGCIPWGQTFSAVSGSVGNDVPLSRAKSGFNSRWHRHIDALSSRAEKYGESESTTRDSQGRASPPCAQASDSPTSRQGLQGRKSFSQGMGKSGRSRSLRKRENPGSNPGSLTMILYGVGGTTRRSILRKCRPSGVRVEISYPVPNFVKLVRLLSFPTMRDVARSWDERSLMKEVDNLTPRELEAFRILATILLGYENFSACRSIVQDPRLLSE